MDDDRPKTPTRGSSHQRKNSLEHISPGFIVNPRLNQFKEKSRGRLKDRDEQHISQARRHHLQNQSAKHHNLQNQSLAQCRHQRNEWVVRL